MRLQPFPRAHLVAGLAGLAGLASIAGVAAIAALAGCRDGSATRGTPAPEAAAPVALGGAAAGGADAAPAASTSFYAASRFTRRPTVPAMTDLGRRLFFDPELSASRKMSCATCHDPRFAYGPPDDRSAQPGGPDLRSPGMRAVPSLRYLQDLPPFEEHHFDEAVDESIDQGPTGGHGWDGRVDTTHDQARLPLTSPFEMANASLDAVVQKVAASAYASQFRDALGEDVFSDPARGSAAVLMALEVFQQSPRDFYPYTSRYDAYLRRQGELSPREQRGMALFADPKKGNCAACHPNQIRKGAFPNFTDFGFAAIGVPRNRGLAANTDAGFFDLGLCGPLRTDLSAHEDYCGQFRVPTLRNVALRRVFFHNGVFHRMGDVLAFYAQRDSSPAKFYVSPGGHVVPFDDLPEEHRANVNREPPFGRKPGAPAALTTAEIQDVIAYLETLTDADVAPPGAR